jgi:hypothetical protein
MELTGTRHALNSNGRTIWIVDAHRGDRKRYVVHADEKLTTFLELAATSCQNGITAIHEQEKPSRTANISMRRL